MGKGSGTTRGDRRNARRERLRVRGPVVVLLLCRSWSARALTAPQGGLSSCVYAGERADNVAPAIGLEPITCRLTEGLSQPGIADS